MSEQDAHPGYYGRSEGPKLRASGTVVSIVLEENGREVVRIGVAYETGVDREFAIKGEWRTSDVRKWKPIEGDPPPPFRSPDGRERTTRLQALTAVIDTELKHAKTDQLMEILATVVVDRCEMAAREHRVAVSSFLGLHQLMLAREIVASEDWKDFTEYDPDDDYDFDEDE